MFSYLPWLNILTLLEIALNIYLLRQGIWNAATRVVKIVLELASLALAVAMLKGPDLVALTPSQLADTPLEESARVFTTIVNLIPTLVLTIIIVSSIEVAQMAYRLLKSRPASPYPVMK